MTQTEAHPASANGVAERLRAELEQAHVAMEDMSERVSELARVNEELAAKLKNEARLRALTEMQLQELREQAQSHGSAEQADGAALRQELSVALEELQVMQEELQAAHDALSGAQPPPPQG
jgi:DNA anti-recombination protein RmuC